LIIFHQAALTPHPEKMAAHIGVDPRYQLLVQLREFSRASGRPARPKTRGTDRDGTGCDEKMHGVMVGAKMSKLPSIKWLTW